MMVVVGMDSIEWEKGKGRREARRVVWRGGKSWGTAAKVK